MAHPLYWPGRYFFYAIGNTSAICLTRDLAPEQPADILLLGCGDPRNVLYTIFCEPPNMDRSLDFTCCDYEPGILARNVILLSMIADKQSVATIWNIFYHFYLDKDSSSTLTAQINKLIGFSDSLQHWNSSVYGGFLKMSTEYTLVELRRHWTLYRDMVNLPSERTKAVRDAFAAGRLAALDRFGAAAMSSARSYGPLLMNAASVEIASKQVKNYWKTGSTFTDPRHIAAATELNPTFCYTLAGEGFAVHYGTDPLIPFHLSALLGNSKGRISIADAVNAAKLEFTDWCSAYHRSISSAPNHLPTIRFFLGDALNVCHVLREFSTTGTFDSRVPVAQWKTQLIKLNKDEYVSGGAPALFDVIDTSNLVDHLGLLNILTAASPLLSATPESNSPVLYTESLLSLEQDVTREFNKRLYANITTVGLLIDLIPIDYLSGFTTRSNTHELMMAPSKKEASEVTQFHQVITWKSPASGDPVACSSGVKQRPPVFASRQLGTFFYDMYHQIFEQEDSRTFYKVNEGNMAKAMASADVRIRYMRESFVLFLKLVKSKLSISEEKWLAIMDRFLDLQGADISMPMDQNNRNDLCVHLHLHGMHTIAAYRDQPRKIGRFADWDTVPPIVRIILVVPRHKLKPLEDSGSTPPLLCYVHGMLSHNAFTSVHAAFGNVVAMGTKKKPWVVFEEDVDGWNGSSPLVVSFPMSARLLTDIEPFSNLEACLAVRSTLGTTDFVKKLGLGLAVFGAKLTDESQVHIIPEQALPCRRALSSLPESCNAGAPDMVAQIGVTRDVSVELDEQCELVASLTAKITIENDEVTHHFQSGDSPEVTQVSPCVMRVTIASCSQDVPYPFPIIGSQVRLRLARKSLYIEVVVPVAGPFLKADGMKLNPFPVGRVRRIPNPWNIHHINLSCLPILDIKASGVDKWFGPHVASMLSARERALRKKHKNDALMFIKDSLCTIFAKAAGVKGGPVRRVLALQDETARNCDTLFFISDIRFDLSGHTLVCDGYVLPLTKALLLKIGSDFGKLVHKGNLVYVPVFEGEMQGWKQLIPAFVERCRTWKHGSNCEYESQGRIPLTEVMEVDPLCSCGRGKDTEGMLKVPLWKKLAPYVTRIALSPLFAVSYLETVGRDPAAHKCSVCRGKGTPRLKTCTVCQKVRYCSQACQKKDWKVHKLQCKSC